MILTSPAPRAARLRARVAAATVLGFTAALSFPLAAHADPVTLLNYTDPGGTYSILVTKDGDTFSSLEVTVTNLSSETTTYGLAADLTTPTVLEDLWEPSLFGDEAQATIAPGDSETQDLPMWPGTELQFFSNVDGSNPFPIGPMVMTPGTHVRTHLAGGPDNLTLEIGPPVTWSPDPVLPGAGIAVTASQLTPGPVEVYLDGNANFDWSGDNLIQTQGSPVEDLGSGVVAADGTLSLDGLVPADTPEGQYTIEFANSSGLGVHLSFPEVDVDSGTPDTVQQGTATIAGKAKVNGTLSVDAEGWSDPGVQLQYQWSADNAPIVGATSSTFVPTDAQAGSTITVAVTGWAPGEAPSAAAISLPTSAIPAAKTFTSTSAPTISGTVAVGDKLTASVADWAPTSGFDYQWQVNGLPVGTDSKNYTLAPADQNGTVTVTITSAKAGYTATQQESDPTTAVAAGVIQPPANANKPSIGGQEKVAGSVTLKMGNWSPTPTFVIQWFIGGVAVPGATGTSLTIPSSVNNVSTIGSLVSAQLIASSPGYADDPVTVPDPTAITKAAKTS
ncbi:MAG TPA: hypothetical protein VHX87_01060 [Galbitalea sp.]|jgi:hypothetical protein|nr:hypothetical protein [Galbitalea sp.]